MALAKFDRAAIARGQRLIFALGFRHARPGRRHESHAAPADDTFGDFGAAGLAAMERAAFGQQLGPGRAMDRAIHPATAEQRGVRGVDDGVNAQGRDVGDDDFSRAVPIWRAAKLRRRQPR